MANVKFNKGLYANLPAQSTEGALYFTTDESIYLGLANGQYHRFGDFIEVASVEALPADGAHVKALYYCTLENVLAKWDGSAWKQINLDTDTTYEMTAGATAGSIKLIGKNKKGTQVSSVELQVVDVAGLNEAIADAKKAGTDAQAYAEALSDKVGEVENGKTVVGMISDNATEIADLAAIVSAMTGDEEGSVGSISEAIKAQIDALDVTDEAVEGQFVVAVSETDGKITVTRASLKVSDIPEIGQDKVTGLVDAIADAKKAGTDANNALETYKGTNDVAVKEAKDAADEAKATADAKVASVTAGDASVTVAGTSTEPTVAVKLDPSADNAIKLGENGLKVEIGAAPEYSIVKAADSGEYAAIYNLTKDGVNVGASINIPKDLVVKSGSVVDGDIVLVLNDEANTEIVIPADSLIEYVTSGSVAGDMVVINVDESTHKVTATITDGTIGLAKLTTEVQTAIGKAHSHAHLEVLEGITADKVSAWDASEQNAKDYADGLDEAMDIRVKAIEDDYLKEADIANKADKATTLAGYGITDAMTADAIAQAIEDSEYDDTALVGRVDALEAIDHDAYVDADTQVLTDAKAYADGLAGNYDASGSASTAEQNAKDYADSAVETAMTWGEF